MTIGRGNRRLNWLAKADSAYSELIIDCGADDRVDQVTFVTPEPGLRLAHHRMPPGQVHARVRRPQQDQ